MPRIETFQVVETSVDGTPSATTTEMPEGFTRGVVSEAANNVYTITFTEPFQRTPTVSVTAFESGTGVSYIPNLTAVSTTAVSWRSENDASAAGAATRFHVIVVGYDTPDVL